MTANASSPNSDLQPDLHPDSVQPQTESNQAEIEALKAELHQTRLAYQMALEMAQFQAGFLARTSHELRSPINSVIGLHQLILADLCDSPAEEREFVAQAHSAAQKMLGLMDELIYVSQLVRNTAKLKPEPVPLDGILAAVQRTTHLQAKNRGLQLEIQQPDPSVNVLADERRLRQVLLNLVDMPLSVMQQGFVRVTVQVLADAVQIEIADQRPPECWQEPTSTLRSFAGTDPLSQLSRSIDQQTGKASTLQALSRSPIPPSIGLNLFVQQAILELMGGQLTLLETPVQPGETGQAGGQAEGITRIRCTLPLAKPS